MYESIIWCSNKKNIIFWLWFCRLDLARRLSKDVFRSKSSSNLSIRRLSSDINMAAGRFLDCHGSQAIGRRLSRDTNLSPPDINSRRASHLSVYRKTSNQFLSPGSDLDSGSDISVPKSPIPLSIPVCSIVHYTLFCIYFSNYLIYFINKVFRLWFIYIFIFFSWKYYDIRHLMSQLIWVQCFSDTSVFRSPESKTRFL